MFSLSCPEGLAKLLLLLLGNTDPGLLSYNHCVQMTAVHGQFRVLLHHWRHQRLAGDEVGENFIHDGAIIRTLNDYGPSINAGDENKCSSLFKTTQRWEGTRVIFDAREKAEQTSPNRVFSDPNTV